MRCSILTTAFASALLVFCHGLPCFAQEDAKKKPKAGAAVVSLNSIRMEVSALRALYQLDLSKAQLESLQQLAAGLAQKDQKRNVGKATKEYRDKLLELRKALIDGKDGGRILKLDDELDALRDKEKPAFDDHVEITAASQGRTADALRLLKPRQIAVYIGHIAEDIDDPQLRLAEGLDEARAMSEEEWKEQRAELAEDISRLAVGLESAKAKAMNDQIVALMLEARKLTKADFQQQQGELKKSARKIIGDVSAMDVIRHQVEIDLATLMANPRLPQALRARLK